MKRGRQLKPATTALGAFIRERRLELNMTPGEVSEKADLSRGYLSRLETGSSVSPSEDALSRLAAALEVDLQELRRLVPRAERQTFHLRSFNDELSGIDELIDAMKSRLEAVEAARSSLRSSEEQLAKIAWTLELNIRKLESAR